MRKVFFYIFLLIVAGPVAAGSDDACRPEVEDCVPVGQWQFSVGVGLGGRTNPLLEGDDIPIVLLPEISYYGERFFFDTTSLGYTLYEDKRHLLNAVATVGLDSMYFSDISLGNFVIEGTGGGFNVGGLVAADSMDGNTGENIELTPPKDETKTPNTDDIDGPNEFFHKVESSAEEGSGGAVTINLEQIADRKMAGLAGLEYSFLYGATQISVQALQDFTGVHKGQEIRFGLDRYWLHGRNQYSLAGGFVWQSARVVDYYYGLGERDLKEVEGADALYYSADDAVTPYLRADWVRPLTPNWTFQLTVHQKWLGRAIKDSPLVDEGTSTTVFVGGVYHF
ncbi:MipA/OmpV family protein [Gilvimarinus sp. SDUM040013]|uniref:MipA/OmpV family protein n=1 Tax=Gilvimarinus gilvus TaxID=3058038 RepID=A0ABU4RXX2_9GAMM|nr:MipA/OmpV family protein [Gilvimarinus sp. SDUM040013]MDO3386452.1 MipA/OmpV family protein [Gilvimarinus sp. SDUM040013]MDX6849718.1 MipA/OmpV family protein [Gilvimarinus sp. SDUM040013]